MAATQYANNLNKMIILIDNYDSFTYNLVHYFQEIGEDVTVYRNDEKGSDFLIKANPKFFVISLDQAVQRMLVFVWN